MITSRDYLLSQARSFEDILRKANRIFSRIMSKFEMTKSRSCALLHKLDEGEEKSADYLIRN